MISGVFQIFDGLQAVVLGALRGIQDVFVPTVLIFIAYILVGLPVSYYLGLNTHLGVVGIWIGLLIGLIPSITTYFINQEIKMRQVILLKLLFSTKPPSLIILFITLFKN